MTGVDDISDARSDGKRLAGLSLAALGVLYGDIGTSPLYAMRECFAGGVLAPTPDAVLGVLSLIFWTLTLVVSLKYLVFVVRADNRGEGGVIALTALLRGDGARPVAPAVLIGLGLFATSLLYGDGMITPAISVLSAVEGLEAYHPALAPYVVPLTIVILVALFRLQRHGTAQIGALFGPITLIWLLTISALGIASIARRPEVLFALDPRHAMLLLWQRGPGVLPTLGAIFLVATGAEALYADMGHFGRTPIRLTWFGAAMPALLCNYFGQGAALLADPSIAADPFYALAPRSLLLPLIGLATAATVIASQAVITGAFSVTRQAIQLGYLPRVRIHHTSATEEGQIMVPLVSDLLMVATIALVVGFGSSGALAHAYGVAVASTMTITTLLLHAVARRRWGWSRLTAGLLCGTFLAIDLAFLVANSLKLSGGAWVPLAVGLICYLLMTTWQRGRQLVAARLFANNPPLRGYVATLAAAPPPRVDRPAAYMATTPGQTPPALLRGVRHFGVLHQPALVVSLVFSDQPTVSDDDRVVCEKLGEDVWRIEARLGYLERADVPRLLALAAASGAPAVDPAELTYVVGRERVVRCRAGSAMVRWRLRLFSALLDNAQNASLYFGLPPSQVVELGAQVEL